MCLYRLFVMLLIHVYYSSGKMMWFEKFKQGWRKLFQMQLWMNSLMNVWFTKFLRLMWRVSLWFLRCWKRVRQLILFFFSLLTFKIGSVTLWSVNVCIICYILNFVSYIYMSDHLYFIILMYFICTVQDVE